MKYANPPLVVNGIIALCVVQNYAKNAEFNARNAKDFTALAASVETIIKTSLWTTFSVITVNSRLNKEDALLDKHYIMK